MVGRYLRDPTCYVTLCRRCHDKLHHPSANQERMVITDQERETLLIPWAGIINESKNPSEYLAQWRISHPDPWKPKHGNAGKKMMRFYEG